jgi:hypothetical protein
MAADAVRLAEQVGYENAGYYFKLFASLLLDELKIFFL